MENSDSSRRPDDDLLQLPPPETSEINSHSTAGLFDDELKTAGDVLGLGGLRADGNDSEQVNVEERDEDHHGDDGNNDNKDEEESLSDDGGGDDDGNDHESVGSGIIMDIDDNGNSERRQGIVSNQAEGLRRRPQAGGVAEDPVLLPLPNNNIIITETSSNVGIAALNAVRSEFYPDGAHTPPPSSSVSSTPTHPCWSWNRHHQQHQFPRNSFVSISSVLDTGYQIVNARPTTMFLLAFTIYILFGDDIRIISAPPSADAVFQVLASICFLSFLIEILARSVCESDFRLIAVPKNTGKGNITSTSSADKKTHDTLPALSSTLSSSNTILSFFRSCFCMRDNTSISNNSIFAYSCRIEARGYFGSFLFMLDALAIISILPEVDWVWGAVLTSLPSSTDTQGNLSTVRASRISRLGSRVGRIIRMVRLVRLFKLYSFWRRYFDNRRRTNNNTTFASARKSWFEFSARTSLAEGGVRESQIGTRLQHSITRRVIVMVIMMLLVVPAFVHSPDDNTEESATSALHFMNIWRGPGWSLAASTLLTSYATYGGSSSMRESNSGGVGTSDGSSGSSSGWMMNFAGLSPPAEVLSGDILAPRVLRVILSPMDDTVPTSLLVDRYDVYSQLRLDSLTYPEVRIQSFTSQYVKLWNGTILPSVTTTVWWNEKPPQRNAAIHTIGLTLFIMFILGIGALQLAADAQDLVLAPIESMIAFVEKMALDPVSSRISSRDNTGSYETKVLENAIKKVTGLLRVGFGSLGALIVAKHLDARSQDAVTYTSSSSWVAAGAGVDASPPSAEVMVLPLAPVVAAGEKDILNTSFPRSPSPSIATAPSSPPQSTRAQINIHSQGRNTKQNTVTSFTSSMNSSVNSAEGRNTYGRNSTAANDGGGGGGGGGGGSGGSGGGTLSSYRGAFRSSRTLRALFGNSTGDSSSSSSSPSLSVSGTRDLKKTDWEHKNTGQNNTAFLPPNSLHSSSSSSATTTTMPLNIPVSGPRREAGLFNPFIPGRSVRAIIVRIGIPNADAIADALGEDYLLHSNRIAKIVHDTILAWGGSPVTNTNGSGFTCSFVIDDAWDALLDNEETASFVVSGSGKLASIITKDIVATAAAANSTSMISEIGIANENADKTGGANTTTTLQRSGLNNQNNSETIAATTSTAAGNTSVAPEAPRRSSILDLLRMKSNTQQQQQEEEVSTNTQQPIDKLIEPVAEGNRPMSSSAAPSRRTSIHTERAAHLGSAVTGFDSIDAASHYHPPLQQKAQQNQPGNSEEFPKRPLGEAHDSHASVLLQKPKRLSLPRRVFSGSAAVLTPSSSSSSSSSSIPFPADPIAAILAHSHRVVTSTTKAIRRSSRNGIPNPMDAVAIHVDGEVPHLSPPALPPTINSVSTTTHQHSEATTQTENTDQHKRSGKRASVTFSAETMEIEIPTTASSTAVPITAASSLLKTEEGRARLLLLRSAAEVAERALFACLKIIVRLRRARDVHESKEVAALRNSASPLLRGYKPSLSFGLHVGHAVEAAIGSVRRVDVSYISPSIAVAGMLETVAPIYHTPVLMSGSFTGLLSPYVKSLCRKLDVVELPASLLVPSSSSSSSSSSSTSTIATKASHEEHSRHQHNTVAASDSGITHVATILSHSQQRERASLPTSKNFALLALPPNASAEVISAAASASGVVKVMQGCAAIKNSNNAGLSTNFKRSSHFSTTSSSATSNLMSLFTYDTWDWTASLPPSILRARMMQMLPLLAADRGGLAAPSFSSSSSSASSSSSSSFSSPSEQPRLLPSPTAITPNLMAPQDMYIPPEAAAGLPPFLLPFAIFASSIQDADLFNQARHVQNERERCVSIMGAADIIEHPIRYAKYNRKLWDTDPEVVALRAPFSSAFRTAHTKAMHAYLSGDWSKAAQHLIELGKALATAAEEKTLQYQPQYHRSTTAAATAIPPTAVYSRPSAFRLSDLDYASRTLYTYMAAHRFTPPPGWRPVRKLVGRGSGGGVWGAHYEEDEDEDDDENEHEDDDENEHED